MNDADRVVVVLGRLALEDRVPALGFDESEAERLRDGGRRDLAGRHQLHELETRPVSHGVPKGERVVQQYVRVRSVTRGTLATDRVALHPARVRPCAEKPVRLAGDRGDPARRPGGPERDVVTAPLEVGDGPRVEPRLERERLGAKPRGKNDEMR